MPVTVLENNQFAITESTSGSQSQSATATSASSVSFTANGSTITMNVNLLLTFQSPQVNTSGNEQEIIDTISSCSVCDLSSAANTVNVFSALMDMQTQLSGEQTKVTLTFVIDSKKGKFGATAELEDILLRLTTILQTLR